MFVNRVLISVLALAAVAIPASATTTTVYCSNGCGANNEAAFNSATASLFFGSGLENFTAPNGTYSSGLVDADSTTGLDFFGYSFTTQNGVTVTGGVLGQTASGQNTTLQAQLPAGIVYAFAGTISATTASSPCFETAGIVSSGNCNNTVVITGPSDIEFFGVLSTTPLASVYLGTFNGNPGSLRIDTFELGEQADAPTPEVATLLMIGSGLIMMRFLKRRASYSRAAAASSRNQVAEPSLRVALRVAN